jgi:hypothetical protein
MRLPGTSRDLKTVEAHLERVRKNAINLYKFRSMDLTKMDGSQIVGQSSMLADIRHDLCVMRSAVEAYERKMAIVQSIASSDPETFAATLREMAQQALDQK